ncbi:DUF1270 family protein [Staphylococcus aureus]|nr:DUF1270 family protein [Staphylococcus aureus]
MQSIYYNNEWSIARVASRATVIVYNEYVYEE